MTEKTMDRAPVHLIVDSTCDMPAEWKDQYDIITMPLGVVLNGKEYKDGVDLSLDELHDAMRAGIIPKTTQVPPGEMLETFRACLNRGEDVLYIAFSAAMSGTFRTASVVMDKLREDYPDRRMAVVDSKGGCLGSGLLAGRVAELLADGADLDTAVTAAEGMAEQEEYLFTIPNLDWMVKGGRVGHMRGYLGDKLNIKPILDVENGMICVVRKVRGMKKALGDLVDHLADSAAGWPVQIVGIAHSADLATAKTLDSMVKTKLPQCRTVICEIGEVLTTHLGIGGVAVFWFPTKGTAAE